MYVNQSVTPLTTLPAPEFSTRRALLRPQLGRAGTVAPAFGATLTLPQRQNGDPHLAGIYGDQGTPLKILCSGLERGEDCPGAPAPRRSAGGSSRRTGPPCPGTGHPGNTGRTPTRFAPDPPSPRRAASSRSRSHPRLGRPLPSLKHTGTPLEYEANAPTPGSGACHTPVPRTTSSRTRAPGCPSPMPPVL